MDTAAGMDRLAGTVHKIIYRSEDSLYTVALLRTTAGTETVCGCFYVLLPGDEVVLFGAKGLHSRYGEQFQVVRYEKPFTPHFTNQAAGPLHWQQVEDALIRLQEYGFTMAEALRAYAAYGDEIESILQENPYRLTGEPVHLSFLTADRTAEKLGISAESAYRLQSALAEIINNALTFGHTCISENDLQERASSLLFTRPTEDVEGVLTLETELEKMAEEGRIHFDEAGFLYRMDAYLAESGIAADILRLQKTWSGPLLQDTDAALIHGEQQLGLSLALVQKQVLKKVLSHPVSIITGGPGTGKTTILRALLEAIAVGGFPERVLLAAPTGRAAKRLAELTGKEAQTIHRLLGARGTDAQVTFEYQRDNPLVGDLLIVDEMSMVDVFLFSHLLEALPEGMGMILVGDANQLPSVGAGQVFQDLMGSGRIPVSELSTIFRQAEASAIVLSAHCIRQGQQPPLHRQDGEFRFLYRNNPEEITLALMQELEGLLEQGYTMDDIQILCPFHRGETGTGELNRLIRDWANPWEAGVPEARALYEVFRRGDKVMQMRNDYEKGVFNGNIGQVIDAEAGPEPLVEIRYDDRCVIYRGEEMNDLSLAYAISVHKSQGSEFPVVMMPVYWPLRAPVTRNLLYTAVTRARHQVILIGRKQDLLWGIRNQRSGQRCTRLAERLRKD